MAQPAVRCSMDTIFFSLPGSPFSPWYPVLTPVLSVLTPVPRAHSGTLLTRVLRTHPRSPCSPQVPRAHPGTMCLPWYSVLTPVLRAHSQVLWSHTRYSVLTPVLRAYLGTPCSPQVLRAHLRYSVLTPGTVCSAQVLRAHSAHTGALFLSQSHVCCVLWYSAFIHEFRAH